MSGGKGEARLSSRGCRVSGSHSAACQRPEMSLYYFVCLLYSWPRSALKLHARLKLKLKTRRVLMRARRASCGKIGNAAPPHWLHFICFAQKGKEKRYCCLPKSLNNFETRFHTNEKSLLFLFSFFHLFLFQRLFAQTVYFFSPSFYVLFHWVASELNFFVPALRRHF